MFSFGNYDQLSMDILTLLQPGTNKVILVNVIIKQL
jgi:hypothetical protein